MLVSLMINSFVSWHSDLLETTILQCPHKDKPSKSHLSDLQSSSYLDRFQRTGLLTGSLVFAVVVIFTLHRDVFSLPCLHWKLTIYNPSLKIKIKLYLLRQLFAPNSISGKYAQNRIDIWVLISVSLNRNYIDNKLLNERQNINK